MYWYLRSPVLPRDVEEPLADRGIEADHATVFRWVVRFAPLFAEAAPPCRHNSGNRWFVGETQVKVLGRWRYLYRAVDKFGQVMDVLVSPKRDKKAARRFFTRALAGDTTPVEVTTDRAAAYPRVLDELLHAAQHLTVPYANNRVEADHGRLKARPRSMCGLKRDHSLRIVAAGHAFVENLRRGHYELATEVGPRDRLAAAFTELAPARPLRCRFGATRAAPSSDITSARRDAPARTAATRAGRPPTGRPSDASRWQSRLACPASRSTCCSRCSE